MGMPYLEVFESRLGCSARSW